MAWFMTHDCTLLRAPVRFLRFWREKRIRNRTWTWHELDHECIWIFQQDQKRYHASSLKSCPPSHPFFSQGAGQSKHGDTNFPHQSVASHSTWLSQLRGRDNANQEWSGTIRNDQDGEDWKGPSPLMNFLHLLTTNPQPPATLLQSSCGSNAFCDPTMLVSSSRGNAALGILWGNPVELALEPVRTRSKTDGVAPGNSTVFSSQKGLRGCAGWTH